MDNWLVTGVIPGAGTIKGVRRALYTIASFSNAFYDGDHPCFWYPSSSQDLHLRVLFRSFDSALNFETQVQEARVNSSSPFAAVATDFNLTIEDVRLHLTSRIFSHHYRHDASDSPQAIMSLASSVTTILDSSRPLFKYQRLEAESHFGSHYKADSCHLISASYYRNHPDESDDPENNRLALSCDVHHWLDGLNVDVPLFHLTVVEATSKPVLQDRFLVKLLVTAFDEDAARLLFHRLKEGSERVSPLEYHVPVFVLDPLKFKECIEWKRNVIENEWKIAMMACAQD